GGRRALRRGQEEPRLSGGRGPRLRTHRDVPGVQVPEPERGLELRLRALVHREVTDPFTILGIEPRFRLDLERVGARHRELSRALHPDRYVDRPANERRLALSRAIEVNQAFGIVRDPVRRALALLARHGV